VNATLLTPRTPLGGAIALIGTGAHWSSWILRGGNRRRGFRDCLVARATLGVYNRGGDTKFLREPTAGVVVAVATIGIVSAILGVLLRLASDHSGPDPGLQAALLDWILLAFIVSGLVAWWRRPENRFGPLMIAAGLALCLSCLQSANWGLPFTIGQAFDLLPIALFVHVFLAFPTGYLRSRVERVLVGAAYFVAVGLQVAGLLLGGFGPDNVVALTSEPAAAAELFDIQLLALAAVCLGGLGALVARRQREPRMRRRSAQLLVDLFAVVLVMCAALLISALYFPGEGFLWIQRSTFFLIGLAPLAFLAAILDARLARSAVGELLVALQADPSPTDLREPLARALGTPRSKSRTGCPSTGAGPMRTAEPWTRRWIGKAER
jgi:hypothetical protein